MAKLNTEKRFIRMDIEITKVEKEGKSYVQMPYEDYESLLERLEDAEDICTIREAISSDEEKIPFELVKKEMNGENPVKIYREYRGLTQQQLANKSGVNRVYITQIENGKKPGSVNAYKALSKTLNIDMEILIPND
jgi:DNA-binding XRE family transcriptional regulator